jgi:tetratricopeptide (TPR) repeat protein
VNTVPISGTIDQPSADLRRDIVQQWSLVHRHAAIQRLAIAQAHRERPQLLATEFPNLEASHAWLALQQDALSARLLIAYTNTLAPYLMERSLPGTLLRWCDEALATCERLQEAPEDLLLLRIEAQHALAQWEAARASIEEVLRSREMLSEKHQGRATFALGRLELNQGHYERALALLSQAEQHLSDQSDVAQLVAVRAEIAAYYLQRDDLDRALNLYRDVDRLQRGSGGSESGDHVLLMLGIVYRKQRDYARAAIYLQQLLTRATVEGRQNALATAAHHLAWVWINVGHLRRARHLAGQAIARYQEIGDTRGLSDAYEQLGVIALAERNSGEAEVYLQRSLAIRRSIGNEHGIASCLRHLGLVALRKRQGILAIRYLWQSLSAYHRIGVLSRQRLLRIMGEIRKSAFGKSQWSR